MCKGKEVGWDMSCSYLFPSVKCAQCKETGNVRDHDGFVLSGPDLSLCWILFQESSVSYP